jgi:hypothetical protein
MSFLGALPQSVIARNKRQCKPMVDQATSGFQEPHHIQERRLLRSFVARNDSGGRRLLRSFVARNDSGERRLLRSFVARNDIKEEPSLSCHCEPMGSNLLVDRIASGFQELHHMQERRLLRSFVARNDSGGRRLLRSFVARNDIKEEPSLNMSLRGARRATKQSPG